MLNREYRTLHVLARLGITNCRIPMRTGPAALSLRAEESGSAAQGRPNNKLETYC